ncbi:MAG TPA: hypothetical protein VI873_02870 [Candidatus Peribacteraceae bacterium]|nr:hypothetical protein [Candidatus Peribacteraceae bacterium]
MKFIASNARCEGDYLGQLPEKPVANPNPELALCEISLHGHREHASVEVVLDHERMSDAELLPEHYRGTGIYLKNYYRQGGEVVPFWVVIRGQEFTRSRMQKILSFIAHILEFGDYKHERYWEIN